MKLAVREGRHGRGVFAGEPIPAGALIARFSGPFLRYAQTSATTYALQIGPDLYIGESGGVDDLFNHSCDPNAGVKISGTSAELRAIRDIVPDEEIAFDYSTTLDEGDFTMPCRCGSPACRHLIGDGRDLPQSVWERYMKLGILSDYVVRSRLKKARA
ncbi:MAG: SET domain-containing protein [Spirochaetia bacterium]|jgi:SET domain-containing protein